MSSRVIKTLGAYVDCMTTLNRMLEASRHLVKHDSYGAMLSSIFMNKLPPELRLIVSMQVSESELGMATLMKIVEEELVARK